MNFAQAAELLEAARRERQPLTKLPEGVPHILSKRVDKP